MSWKCHGRQAIGRSRLRLERESHLRFVYQLALLFRFEHHLDLYIGLKAA
jgi:hypothetical protein